MDLDIFFLFDVYWNHLYERKKYNEIVLLGNTLN
jgi:hypothetical protein